MVRGVVGSTLHGEPIELILLLIISISILELDVLASADGAMGSQIDPSWWTYCASIRSS